MGIKEFFGGVAKKVGNWMADNPEKVISGVDEIATQRSIRKTADNTEKLQTIDVQIDTINEKLNKLGETTNDRAKNLDAELASIIKKIPDTQEINKRLETLDTNIDTINYRLRQQDETTTKLSQSFDAKLDELSSKIPDKEMINEKFDSIDAATAALEKKLNTKIAALQEQNQNLQNLLYIVGGIAGFALLVALIVAIA